MTPLAKAELVKIAGREVGFDLVGITSAAPVERATYYKSWVAAGYGGSMAYLRRNAHLREEPGRLLPGARSIICVALQYGRDPAAVPDSRRPLGRVASYAWGRDYHVVVRGMLIRLSERIREQVTEPFDYRICVDTVPLLERELAARAGLGWIGKNTCLLNQELGSCLFLGGMITTLDLAPADPVRDRCARCTRCLDACPTRAFLAPYQLNASRCISYLTIEQRDEVPAEFHRAMGDWVFGCDICQQVCPYNRRAPRATRREVTAARTPPYVDLLELLWLDATAYRRLTSWSAGKRAERVMWRRNAAIALGNADALERPIASEVRDALLEVARDDHPIVRHAALHALERFNSRPPPAGAGAAD